MNWDIIKPFLAAYVRKALTAASIYLITKGVLPSNQANEFVGAGMLFASIAWEAWHQYGQAIVAGLLKKLTAKPTVASAVTTAQAVAPGAAVKAIALFAILVLGTLIVATPGHAQLRRPAVTGNLARDLATDAAGGSTAKPSIAGVTLTGDITKDGPKIWAAILAANSADLSYAAAMATAAQTPASKTRLQCLNAITAVNAQASGTSLLAADGKTPLVKPDPHAISDIESMAELVDNLSPQGALYTSCAGAATMFKTNVLALINALVTGAAAFGATGGVTP